MPRLNAPFYRTQKDSWYGRIHGRVVSLGVRGRGNRKSALEEFARKLLDRTAVTTSAPTIALNGAATLLPPVLTAAPVPSIEYVITQFLADAAARVSLGCLRNYRLFLLPIAATIGSQPSDTVTATQIEAHANNPKWSSTYRSNSLAAVTTCFRWATRRRLLSSNPLPPLTKPPKNSRGADTTVAPAEYAALLRHTNPLFRDYLKLLWGTGARPGEIAGLTAEMVNEANDGVIPLRQHKTAHRGRVRLLILTGEALVVAKRRAKALRSGLLFPGRNGKMTSNSIGSRLTLLCRKAGIRNVMAYGFRHTFATDALAKGVPDATVAALLGHSGTAMLHRHYSHLTSRTKELTEALRQVRTGPTNHSSRRTR